MFELIENLPFTLPCICWSSNLSYFFNSFYFSPLLQLSAFSRLADEKRRRDECKIQVLRYFSIILCVLCMFRGQHNNNKNFITSKRFVLKFMLLVSPLISVHPSSDWIICVMCGWKRAWDLYELVPERQFPIWLNHFLLPFSPIWFKNCANAKLSEDFYCARMQSKRQRDFRGGVSELRRVNAHSAGNNWWFFSHTHTVALRVMLIFRLFLPQRKLIERIHHSIDTGCSEIYAQLFPLNSNVQFCHENHKMYFSWRHSEQQCACCVFMCFCRNEMVPLIKLLWIAR